MALFDAKTVAKQIRANWERVPLLRSFPAPSEGLLCRTLETAFLVSLQNEESRTLRFRMILMSKEEAAKEDCCVMCFSEPLPLSHGELKRLSPATRLSPVLIAVDEFDDAPRIWGTVDAGSTWHNFERGNADSGSSLPLNLIITVTAPGTMRVSFADCQIFNFEHAESASFSSNVFKFGSINDFFRPILVELLSQTFAQVETPPTDDAFFLYSYGGEYLRFLVRLLRNCEELGHGGMIAVIREQDADAANRQMEIKYETGDLQIWDKLSQHLRLIYDDIELSKKVSGPEMVQRDTIADWRKKSQGRDESEQRLKDLSEFLAGLTQIDGALVITDRLRVMGFGAVIRDLTAVPSQFRCCNDEECQKSEMKLSDGYGTRHRSAIALCRKLECVVFVISQDGGVKALKSVGEEVCLWPDITLSPSAWFPTAEDSIPELRRRHLNQRS